MPRERVPGLALMAAAAVAGAACGGAAATGPGAEASAARSSVYSCKQEEVFAAAVKAVEQNFETVKSQDPREGVVIGEPRWFAKEGAPRPAGVALADLGDGDIALAVRIRVVDLQPNFRLEIDSVVKQRSTGSPQPRDLSEDDPQRPGWVEGKLDRLRLDAHEKLAHCATLERRRSAQ